MANNENLLRGNPKAHFRSGQHAIENGRKGGKKLGENNKKRKEEEKANRTFKDLFLELAQTQVTKENDGTGGKIYKIVKELFPNLSPDDMTQKVMLYASLYRTALKGGKGSVAAFNTIRDTMGEAPKKEFSGLDGLVNIVVASEEDKELMEDI